MGGGRPCQWVVLRSRCRARAEVSARACPFSCRLAAVSPLVMRSHAAMVSGVGAGEVHARVAAEPRVGEQGAQVVAGLGQGRGCRMVHGGRGGRVARQGRGGGPVAVLVVESSSLAVWAPSHASADSSECSRRSRAAIVSASGQVTCPPMRSITRALVNAAASWCWRR